MLDIKQTSETRIIPENHSWATKLQPVWDELRDIPLFEEIATIDLNPDQDAPLVLGPQSHPGTNGHQNLPSANWHTALNGSVPRPESEDVDFEPYLGKLEYLAPGSPDSQEENQSPKIVPKVIVRFRAQDERWPIIAAVDEQGLTCPADHFVIRPRGDLPVEVLAAVLNSPVANAYLSIHQVKVENFLALLQKVPVPRFPYWHIQRIQQLVRNYRKVREEWLQGFPEQWGPAVQTGEGRLEQLESKLLDCYQLSLQAERTLIRYFDGYRKPGPFVLTKVEPSRQNTLCSTVVHVENVRREDGEDIVDAFIFGWSAGYPDKIVHFPLSLIPSNLREKTVKDVGFYAKVNTAAPKEEDLVFEDFELLPALEDSILCVLC